MNTYKKTTVERGSTALDFNIKQRNGPKNKQTKKNQKSLMSFDGASELPPWSRLKTVAGNAEGRLVARKHFI